MIRKLCFILLTSFIINLSISHSLYSEEINKKEFADEKDIFIKANGDLILNDIIVKGNKRTTKNAIKNKINIKQGKRLSEFDPEYLVQELRRLDLYSSIKIKYIPVDKTLVNIEIEVAEKISLIPVPFMRFSRDSKSFGFMLIDRNFLGYHKNLIIGGFWSTEGFNYMLGYMDPSVMDSKYSLNIMNGAGGSEFQSADREGIVYRRYFARSYFSSLGAGYKFSGNWKIAVLNQYYNYRVDSAYSESIDPPKSGRVYKPGARLEFDNLYFDRLFHYGMKAHIEYMEGIPLNEDMEKFNHIEAGMEYNLKVLKEHRFVVNISGGTGNDPVIFYKRISGSPGFRILPYGKIFTNRYAGGAVNYEIPFFKRHFLTSTASGFYEGCGIRNDYSGKIDISHGPGCGFKLYLNKIAFPAVGFDIAYNMATGNSEFSLSIGFYH